MKLRSKKCSRSSVGGTCSHSRDGKGCGMGSVTVTASLGPPSLLGPVQVKCFLLKKDIDYEEKRWGRKMVKPESLRAQLGNRWFWSMASSKKHRSTALAICRWGHLRVCLSIRMYRLNRKSPSLWKKKMSLILIALQLIVSDPKGLWQIHTVR